MHSGRRSKTGTMLTLAFRQTHCTQSPGHGATMHSVLQACESHALAPALTDFQPAAGGRARAVHPSGCRQGQPPGTPASGTCAPVVGKHGAVDGGLGWLAGQGAPDQQVCHEAGCGLGQVVAPKVGVRLPGQLLQPAHPARPGSEHMAAEHEAGGSKAGSHPLPSSMTTRAACVSRLGRSMCPRWLARRRKTGTAHGRDPGLAQG